MAGSIQVSRLPVELTERGIQQVVVAQNKVFWELCCNSRGI
jgi:hypothetical protein